MKTRKGSEGTVLADEKSGLTDVGDGSGKIDLVEKYISNCKKFELQIDSSVVIALKTGWSLLQPTKSFSEGSMLPLMGILDDCESVTKVNLSNVAMTDSRFRSAGNGNSNARVLGGILQRNRHIDELNLSNTGLDDDGIREICAGLRRNESITSLDLSGNHFGEEGAAALSAALTANSSIRRLNLSRNALGFRSIDALLCACAPKKPMLLVDTAGNFVFEEILNAVSHGIGFVGAVVGANILLADAVDTYRTDYHFWACMLYSCALMFLFMSSCLFHSFFMLPSTSRIFQILDHVGIYMVIAGSVTPFLLISLHHHPFARVLLTAEWVAAVLGSSFAACADLNAPSTTMTELSLFLAMGFSMLLVWPLLAAELCSAAITLTAVGTLFYLVGIVFYLLGEQRPIYHVVWHLFVLAAATTHWFVVYFFVLQTDLQLSPYKAAVSGLVDSMSAAAASASATFMK